MVSYRWEVIATRVQGAAPEGALAMADQISIDEEALYGYIRHHSHRLAVRQFRDTPIPDDIVRQIVEAGRLTASSMNGQPWHFIVVQNTETLRQLGALVRTGPYIAQAPMAVVVAITASPFAVSDASRAIQSMVLAAWSRGVASNWTGFHNLEAVKPVLGIPDDVDVLAIVPFGYPVATVGTGKKKCKPLGEVVHLERFGQPYA
jgi:nitroreductase